AAGAYGGGDGGYTNGDDRGCADTGQDYGQGQGEADAPEDLVVGHAHGFSGLKDRGVDSGQADIGVSEDGEEGVENERYDSGAAADAADERDGNQEPEQG